MLVAGAKELAALVIGLPSEVDIAPDIERRIDGHRDRLRLPLARRAAILVSEILDAPRP